MSFGQEEWEVNTAMPSGDEDWQTMSDSLATKADEDTADAITKRNLSTLDRGAEGGSVI
ncbi:hypothetical protein KIN20_032379 [Parelaphostrongylus tenuis]|uniref:Uncharacterized protein n=1 Tax=Parelaphostrongylus tenuis TaxID=148309 RepID=A0AAD5WHN9_PARTN|nr:hypothetical protein KIN20_032379 [Parelaphostrongylus tenuis]